MSDVILRRFGRLSPQALAGLVVEWDASMKRVADRPLNQDDVRAIAENIKGKVAHTRTFVMQAFRDSSLDTPIATAMYSAEHPRGSSVHLGRVHDLADRVLPSAARMCRSFYSVGFMKRPLGLVQDIEVAPGFKSLPNLREDMFNAVVADLRDKGSTVILAHAAKSDVGENRFLERMGGKITARTGYEEGTRGQVAMNEYEWEYPPMMLWEKT